MNAYNDPAPRLRKLSPRVAARFPATGAAGQWALATLLRIGMPEPTRSGDWVKMWTPSGPVDARWLGAGQFEVTEWR